MEGIRTKEDVRFDPRTISRPEFWLMTDAVQATAPPDYYTTITSGCDGKHKDESKHYKGWAKDFRIRDVPGVVTEDINGYWICSSGIQILEFWVRRIRERLGNLYFVELNIPKLHIHAQYNGR